MLSASAALRRIASLVACLALAPCFAQAAPPGPRPFAEPPPDGPVEPSPYAEPPPDDEPPGRERERDDRSTYEVAARPVATHPLVVSIFAPAATNGGRPVETYAELNLLYGQVGALHGVGIGTFSAVEGPAWGLRVAALVNAQTTLDESGGLWVAGLSNFARSDVAGWHVAGLFNRSRALDGVQLAGGFNLAKGLVQGAQIAGGGNVAGELSGLQIAGLFNGAESGSGGQLGAINLGEGEFAGAQIGALNLSLRAFGGAQLGAINYAYEAADALQLGAINAAREVEGGLQIGVINYARRFVRGGLQFGLINVATRGEGTQVGLISVSERLAVEPLAWGSWGRGASYSAGLRLRNGAPYSQIFFTTATAPGRDRLGAGLALGARVSPEGPFFVDLDAAYSYLAPAEAGASAEHRPAARASIGWNPTEHFGVFVGASGGMRLRGDEARAAFEGFAGVHF
ncbi:MAG: hypothetical protein MUF34_36795 [Polyangiaceae bacterium]|jgi:hypothetical protein|nr:hypothetical protein [Polyangiaceae bacterium]